MTDFSVLAPLHALVQQTPVGTRIIPVYSQIVFIPTPISPPISFRSGLTFRPTFLNKSHFHSSRSKKMDNPIIYKGNQLFEVLQLTLLPFECVDPTDLRIIGHKDGRNKNTAAKHLAMWASEAIGPGVLLEYLLYLLTREWKVVRFPQDGSHLTIVKEHAPVTITGSLIKGTIAYDMEWRGEVGMIYRRLTLEEVQEGGGLGL